MSSSDAVARLRVACLASLLLPACGYTLIGQHTKVPGAIQSVAVGEFRNESRQEGLSKTLAFAVEREFYEQHPPRALYKLTKKGADLSVVLQALLNWGNKYLYDGVAAVHEPCGHETKVVTYCEQCDERVPGRELTMKFKRKEAALALGRKA